jgi:hypothetical protein
VVTNGRLPHSNLSARFSNNALPALEVGAELEAVVLDELADGRLLLKIGGSLLEADSPGGLSPGQHLRLRVEQLQPQVMLQITDLEPTIQAQAARMLRQHLPAHADSGELLEQLQTLLTAQVKMEGDGMSTVAKQLLRGIGLLLVDQASVSAEGVQSLLQNGGLYYEAKLARAAHDGEANISEIVNSDLKGLLLAAAEELKSTSLGTEIVQTIHAQLNNVETQQAVNLLAQLSNSGQQLQIPFFNGTNFSTATFSVESDGKGSSGNAHNKSGYNLLFLLDLENFGRTRIDAHVADQSVRVIFYVDRDSSVEMAKEALPGFREVLLDLGYREVLLAVRPLKEIPDEKRQKFDALAVGAPASIHLLDMRA